MIAKCRVYNLPIRTSFCFGNSVDIKPEAGNFNYDYFLYIQSIVSSNL